MLSMPTFLTLNLEYSTAERTDSANILRARQSLGHSEMCLVCLTGETLTGEDGKK